MSLPDSLRMLLASTVLATAVADAQSLVPPPDPAESIVYWQRHAVAPESDPAVGRAQRVFELLLQGWDSARLEPALHVVASGAGPWAASLDDGNILLSRAALDTIAAFGPRRAPHLLAFVLAHELAHQRADDLWHRRFFRLAGTQTREIQVRLVEGMRFDERDLGALAEREARADHDGLVLMASVGFDPYQVLDGKDFFTAWVESLWEQPCEAQAGSREACRQARNRALRARVQLERVASQATLYELGVQSLVAGRYDEARRLLVAFGRDYPSRAVLTSLGSSYLAEALQQYREILARGQIRRLGLFYPVWLQAGVEATPIDPGAVRGAAGSPLPGRIVKLLHEANRYFERALRLEPGHRDAYLLLAVSHLLEGNPYLVRGVVQGRYLPAFGDDADARLLLAMTQVLEGDLAGAAVRFDALLDELDGLRSAMPAELLYYATYHNAAAVAAERGETGRARALWQQLAGHARRNDRGLLFQLAVARLSPGARAPAAPRAPLLVAGARPGEKAGAGLRASRSFETRRLWVDGTPLDVLRGADGARLAVDDGGVVRHAWQVPPGTAPLAGLAIGDEAGRALKLFGLPTRRLHLLSGDYLAYDRLGVAVHVVAGEVEGWFLYPPS